LTTELDSQRQAAEREATNREIRNNLDRQDWAATVHLLARERSSRVAEPTWNHLVADLESRIAKSPDREKSTAALAAVAGDLRDFGELHSLVARLQNASAAERQASIRAAEARIRELDERRQWIEAIAAAEEAARQFPDLTMFSVSAGLLRQKQTTEQREKRLTKLESTILEKRWDEAEHQ
jgi:hypothetical protein